LANYSGTAGNDLLVGTTANDTFNPLTGRDTIVGGGGLDALLLNWTGLLVNGGVDTIWAGPAGTFSGLLAMGDGASSSLQFTAITQLNTLQTQLQASYQTINLLQSLSLANYLK